MPEQYGGGGGSSVAHPDLELPDGWRNGWDAAAANAGSSPVNVAVIGDSISVGQHATTADSTTTDGTTGQVGTSWLAKLRSALVAKYGCYADFWPAWGYSPLAGTDLNGTLPWTTNNSGQAASNQAGNAWSRTWWATAASTQSHQTFTAPYACGEMHFFYEDYAAGTFKFVVDSGTAGQTFSYSIDGGATQTGNTNTQVTITTAGNSTSANTVIRKVRIWNFSQSGRHKLDYGWQSATLVAICAGVTTIRNGATGGISFARHNFQGAWLTDWTTHQAQTNPPDLPSLFQGGQPQGNVPFTTATGFGFPTQPHLLIIEGGINDCNGSATLANYEAALRRLIQAAKRGQANCSVLILLPCFPDSVNSDGSWSLMTNATVAATWTDFLDIARRVARAWRCGFADVHSRWGETPYGSGFLPATDVHPTDAGYADIYSLLTGLNL